MLKHTRRRGEEQRDEPGLAAGAGLAPRAGVAAIRLSVGVKSNSAASTGDGAAISPHAIEVQAAKLATVKVAMAVVSVCACLSKSGHTI